ncbi:LuxR C-terminal-related transcriptional regulator [Sulfitobacter sp. PS-8MA]|uniref:helix-turn-helix transcriptional regulator n=1 Tax=Sulfitobacter sp. PS-8MA TaxID=3237707 RepID=UPI0034C65634
MSDRTALDCFSRCCAEAEDGVALAHCGLNFYAGYGINSVSYHGDDSEATAVQFDRDMSVSDEPRWTAHILDRAALGVSPIENLARRRILPFYWSEVAELTRMTKAEQSYLRRVLKAYPNDGLAIQVHGPQGAAAVVSLGFAAAAPRLSKVDIFTLHSAAQIAHLRYSVMMEDGGAQDANLSPREIEVLEWIAAGKSNGVIAEILGISPHTVDTNVRRIFSKLEVNDRTTAAIRGLGTGILRKPKKDQS